MKKYTNYNTFEADTQKAMLNILEDFSLEKATSEDTQKAVLNILEDFSLEKATSEDNQKALFNILEDFNGEKIKVDLINDELGFANKEMESFSYSISHDLRAPLRAVNGYARILEEDYSNVFDEEGKRLMGVIQQNAIRMGKLIDDLLAFSRLGRKEIKKTNIDMTLLVNHVIAELKNTIPNKAEIRINVLHQVMADDALLQQVMVNLLSNAIKYSSKKDHPVIEVSSKLINGELIYAVSDNGVGFDIQYANKLFGVFQRLHRTEEFEGTGVGLAIVQRIITRHGGTIWGEGILGKGATFFFSLPLSKKGANA